MRAYDLEGLGRHNFEQIAEDLLKNHESIGWERRNYKQVMNGMRSGAWPGGWQPWQQATLHVSAT